MIPRRLLSMKSPSPYVVSARPACTFEIAKPMGLLSRHRYVCTNDRDGQPAPGNPGRPRGLPAGPGQAAGADGRRRGGLAHRIAPRAVEPNRGRPGRRRAGGRQPRRPGGWGRGRAPADQGGSPAAGGPDERAGRREALERRAPGGRRGLPPQVSHGGRDADGAAGAGAAARRPEPAQAPTRLPQRGGGAAGAAQPPGDGGARRDPAGTDQPRDRRDAERLDIDGEQARPEGAAEASAAEPSGGSHRGGRAALPAEALRSGAFTPSRRTERWSNLTIYAAMPPRFRSYCPAARDSPDVP